MDLSETDDGTHDPPGRDRILDAALAEFAASGMSGATIRGIATRARVSPALVQHHFGTKAALRDACDAHVLESVRGDAEAGIDENRIGEPEFIAEVYRSSPPVLRYLARALVDGSDSAASVFDAMVALSERYLPDPPDSLADAHTRAVVFTAMRLGVAVLHEHVSRGLGADLFTQGPRVGRATLDIVAPSLFPDGAAEQVREGLDRYEQGDRR